MKELITEEQAGLIVFWLSVSITLVSFLIGFYLSRKAPKSEKNLIRINSIISAFFGPAVWIFWQYIYNPIEDFYGLDSLKALEINFFIVIGIASVFVALFYFIPGWFAVKPAGKRPK
jgi:hypothetical protein